MKPLRLRARAKINWTLDVLGKRADGYHELDMLLQSVTLCDTLTIEPAETLSLEVQGKPRMHVDGRNLVLRAARALGKAADATRGARITLEKRIPIGAGMGGGSADAAAALIGLNKLWELNLPFGELEQIGLAVGADVPFCIRGGLQRAAGVGEKLRPLEAPKEFYLVAVKPCRGLSTRDVFRELRSDGPGLLHRPDNDAATAALQAGDLDTLVKVTGNMLQPVASALRPGIAECVERIAATGALLSQMTGSGSAVFGVYASARESRSALEALRLVYNDAWMICTADRGVVMEP